ncbi:flagellin [Aliarcobacter faecis]|uniref:flagellin n=1 Tax=Aliarcobacter faecis TaxID=1564138 RepID=UPI0009DE6E8B|nr:flagellin [Aliarcobacter faecis]
MQKYFTILLIKVGLTQNQLESSVRNSMISYVNLKNAESVIRDVDYALESANFNKLNFIARAGSFVQSQANEIEKNFVISILK